MNETITYELVFRKYCARLKAYALRNDGTCAFVCNDGTVIESRSPAGILDKLKGRFGKYI